MKFNKLMVIFIVLLTIVSIGVVSAENMNDTSVMDLADDDMELSEIDYVQDNLTADGVTITSDNLFDYFNDEGILNDEISTDSITFTGEFSNDIQYLSITQPITVTGDGAVFNDIGFKINSDGVTLSNIKFIASTSFDEGLIQVYDVDNTIISDLNVDYRVEDAEAIVINLNGARNTNILNNSIYFESFVPEEKLAIAINIENCVDAIVNYNNINCYLPAVDTVAGEGANFMGMNNVNPVRINQGNRITLKYNNIISDTNSIYGEFPTIQSMIILDSKNSLIDHNNISMTDIITPEDTESFLYGISFAYVNNVTISHCDFSMSTTGGIDALGTAYAIQGIQSDIRMIGNKIHSESKGPMIGIYVTSMEGETSKIDIEGNFINVTGRASSSGSWALVTGIEIQNGNARIFNNTIYTYNINAYDENNFHFGVSYAQYMYGSRSFDIQNNTIISGGKYAISTIATSNGESTPLIAKYNQLQAHSLSGSDAIYTNGINVTIANNTNVAGYILPIDNGSESNSSEDNQTDLNSTTENNSNITVGVNAVWQGCDADVKVIIPNATGTITIKINDKTYSCELIDGIATITLPDGDLTAGVNNLVVLFNNISKTATFNVLNGIVNKNNVLDYFNQSNDGKFYDYVPEGITLDFQGQLLESELGKFNIYISKPVNIISSTNDGYIYLNTLAGNYDGSNPGNRFTIDKNASNTNVTGITFYNTQVWLTNTDHVILDNITVNVLNQKVGSGVGVTSIRDNSSYITVKNSHFSTINNGGSSSLVLGWANYCTVENNTISGDGDVGNLFYLNTYNVNIPSGALVNSYNTIRNNVIYGPSQSSAIRRALVYMGSHNLIENNTIYYSGEGIIPSDNGGGFSDNVIRNNKLYNGASMTVSKGVESYNNYITGKVTLMANSIITNNTVGGLYISGDNVTVNANIINGPITISAVQNTQIKNSNISGDISIERYGENNLIMENSITGTITINGINNILIKNEIKSTGEYAILFTKNYAENNNISYNYIQAMEKVGNDAVNDKYNKNLISKNVPTSSTLEIRVKDIKVGEIALVEMWLNSSSTGSVKLIFNDVETPINMSDGYASFEIPNLAANNYTVRVDFSGDSSYAAKSETRTFTVSKYVSSIDNVDTDLSDFDNLRFSVDLGINASGNLIVTINNHDYSESIINGQSTVVVSNLARGEYNATVTYSGDDKYESSSKEISFIIKSETILIVNVEDINVGDEAKFDISVLDDVTGVVNVIIDNITYNEDIISGKASVKVPNLHYGKYDVVVKYLGDNSYLSCENYTSLKVSKNIITEECFSNDESSVIISLPSDATGSLTVNDKNADIIGGMAKINLDLTPGYYEFTAIYSGDEKYTNTSRLIKLNISKYSSTISVNVDDINVDGIAIFNITVPSEATGKVSVIINNVYYNSSVIGGKATVDVSGLEFGSYNVDVKYYGDEKYFACENSTSLTVHRFKISDDCIEIGQSNVTINLKNDAKGNLTVNGKSSDVIGGKATVTLDLTPGEYEFVAIYSGDSRYENISKKVRFSIPKYYSTISVNVDDINVGDVAIFDVTVPYGATGEVNVIINGIDYNGTVDDGKATVKVSNLVCDNYTVVVKYSGDKNYLSNESTVLLRVSKNTLSNEVIQLTSNKASVSLSEDAGGELIILIDNVFYANNTLVNGNCEIMLPELTAGDYKIDAIYTGDVKYASVFKSITVHVPLVKITGNNLVMLYTSGAKYQIRLTSDGVGLSGQTITFTVNGVRSYAKTDSNGYASVTINLAPKSTVYSLSGEYQGLKTSNTVKVNSILSAKNLKIKKSAKILTIKVTLKKVNGKYLKSKKLTLKFNGKKYNAKTNKNGVATFKIPKKVIKKLNVGKKYVYYAIYLKDTIKKTVTVKK